MMEEDEVNSIKKFEDPGMFLIGFKPMEKLKIHHHVRQSCFLYPEEGEVKGTSVALKKCSIPCNIGYTNIGLDNLFDWWATKMKLKIRQSSSTWTECVSESPHREKSSMM